MTGFVGVPEVATDILGTGVGLATLTVTEAFPRSVLDEEYAEAETVWLPRE